LQNIISSSTLDKTTTKDIDQNLKEEREHIEPWIRFADNITPSFLPYNIRSIYASMFAAIYGNSNAFEPIWFSPYVIYNIDCINIGNRSNKN
jgi:hypothetical protein